VALGVSFSCGRAGGRGGMNQRTVLGPCCEYALEWDRARWGKKLGTGGAQHRKSERGIKQVAASRERRKWCGLKCKGKAIFLLFLTHSPFLGKLVWEVVGHRQLQPFTLGVRGDVCTNCRLMFAALCAE
jgi:hypothetical protein